MRAVIWITEGTWQACIQHARALVPADASVVLLHVAPSDVEELAARGGPRWLGRRPPPAPEAMLRAVADEQAHALLEEARAELDRPAELINARGRVERVVLERCAGADLLLLARDGRLRLGPSSIGPHVRFVLDHASCQVLLVWAAPPHAPEHLPPAPAAPPGAPL